jgi:hypothetical protein
LIIRPLHAEPNTLGSACNDKKGGHGTCTVANLAGKTLGVARRTAEIVVTVIDVNNYIQEHFLDSLLKIFDDIHGRREEVSVVNLSIQGNLASPTNRNTSFPYSSLLHCSHMQTSSHRHALP